MAKKVKQPSYQDYLQEVEAHYNEASAELNIRATHKTQGFDEYDNLYRSYISPDKWPFNSKIFIPLSFKSIYNKDTRLITGKVKGKLVAGNYGNELGAKIGTELLSSQYDDHDNFFEEPLVSKFFRYSQNTRKYGAGFGLVAWRKEVRDGKIVFDGPTFEPLDNRKVYLQPGTVSISSSDYVIVERDATLEQLQTINDQSIAKIGKPAYENLDKLEGLQESEVKKEVPSRNTYIRGLSESKKGKGKFKPFRVLTEYRRDKWITWLPEYGGDAKDSSLGLVIRVVDNPYKHGLIPVVRLVYIPIDDDIYGVSELEPGRSEQKATNALVSGFIESVSNELYPIIKGHPTNVDWKTIEFKPRAAWIMNNPQTDVVRLEGQVTFTRNFVEAYKLLVSSFAESMGDTAADASNMAALATDKTATEIKDLALQRGSRDSLNKVFLSAAITKIYQLWWEMDKQFMTDQKLIRIAGKDAIQYFTEEGLNGWTLSEDGYALITQIIDDSVQSGEPLSFADAYELLRASGTLDEFAVPLYPIKAGQDTLPKLQLNKDGKSGFLAVEKKDMSGQYKFAVDLNTLGVPNDNQQMQATATWYKMAKESEQNLASEGYRLKNKETLELLGDKMQVKNVDQLFESLQPQEEQLNPMAMGNMPPQMPMGPQGPQAPQAIPAQQPITPEQMMMGGGPNG